MINYKNTNYEVIIRELSRLKISNNSTNKILFGFWQQTSVYKLLKSEEKLINEDEQNHDVTYNKNAKSTWFFKYQKAFNLFIENIKLYISENTKDPKLKKRIDEYIKELKEINTIKKNDVVGYSASINRSSRLNDGKKISNETLMKNWAKNANTNERLNKKIMNNPEKYNEESQSQDDKNEEVIENNLNKENIQNADKNILLDDNLVEKNNLSNNEEQVLISNKELINKKIATLNNIIEIYNQEIENRKENNSDEKFFGKKEFKQEKIVKKNNFILVEKDSNNKNYLKIYINDFDNLIIHKNPKKQKLSSYNEYIKNNNDSFCYELTNDNSLLKNDNIKFENDNLNENNKEEIVFIKRKK